MSRKNILYLDRKLKFMTIANAQTAKLLIVTFTSPEF